MKMQLRLELAPRLQQRHDLALIRRLELQQALRLELIRELRGEEYRPHAQCPDCSHTLEPVDILRGFVDDPYDYTTQCPKCETRFECHLRYGHSAGGYVELRYLCMLQTQHRLTEALAEKSPEEIEREQKMVYHSAMVHFGSLRAAFESVGLKYSFGQLIDWNMKVRPFLGKMSDGLIAECAGVSRYAIRKLRTRLKIAAYKRGSV